MKGILNIFNYKIVAMLAKYHCLTIDYWSYKNSTFFTIMYNPMESNKRYWLCVSLYLY